ncbi:MAG: hypothetical protein ACO2OW_00715 [Minisyncoccia bacterium]
MMIYFLLILFLYNSYLYIDLLLPPKINIVFPPENYKTFSPSIKIKGFIDPRADVYINSIFVPKKSKNYFEKDFYLKEGLNRFIIKGVKFWGQEKEVEIKVFYVKK